jgi:hypothetical protein
MQCDACMTSSSVVQDGGQMRWCQGCRHLHPLTNFDGDRRNCRVYLTKQSNYRRQVAGKKEAHISPTAGVGAKVMDCGVLWLYRRPKSMLLLCTNQRGDAFI